MRSESDIDIDIDIKKYRLAVVSDTKHADYGESVRLLATNPDGIYIAWAYGSGKYLWLAEDQVCIVPVLEGGDV